MADLNTLMTTHFAGLGMPPAVGLARSSLTEEQWETLYAQRAARAAWRVEAIKRADAFLAAVEPMRAEATGITELILGTTCATTDDEKAAVALHFVKCLAGAYDAE